ADAFGLCRGRSQTSELVSEIVFSEKHTGSFRVPRASVLEIRGHIHAVKDSRSATQNSIRSKLVGKTKARSEVVSIHWRVATARICKDACAANLADLPKINLRVVGVAGVVQISVHWNVDACISGEVIELESVEALGVGSAPLVAQSEVERQFRCSLPVVLHQES